jgi:hypothetical protein
MTMYYGIVFLLAVIVTSALFKGFFWQYVRVRSSLGRLVLIKLRAVNRDHFKVGKIEEGFLVFKFKKEFRRLAVTDSASMYRSLGVTWIDVDEEKNAIVRPDFSVISGFDAEKFNSLFLRALYKPSLSQNYEIIILIGVGLVFLLVIASLYLMYKMQGDITLIKTALNLVASATPAPTPIPGVL